MDKEDGFANIKALSFFIHGEKTGGILGLGGEVLGKVSVTTLSNSSSSAMRTWEWAVRTGGAWKIEE